MRRKLTYLIPSTLSPGQCPLIFSHLHRPDCSPDKAATIYLIQEPAGMPHWQRFNPFEDGMAVATTIDSSGIRFLEPRDEDGLAADGAMTSLSYFEALRIKLCSDSSLHHEGKADQLSEYYIAITISQRETLHFFWRLHSLLTGGTIHQKNQHDSSSTGVNHVCKQLTSVNLQAHLDTQESVMRYIISKSSKKLVSEVCILTMSNQAIARRISLSTKLLQYLVTRCPTRWIPDQIKDGQNCQRANESEVYRTLQDAMVYAYGRIQASLGKKAS